MKLIKLKKHKNPGKERLSSEKVERDRKMLCGKLSFAGAEAYKLLRANLLFSLPDEKKCRIVGITSPGMGEGKSITSINLAYTLAETGKKVLFIEADMRLPNVAKRLGLPASPGLSNVIAGLVEADKAVRTVEKLVNLNVLVAGDIPPNPSELLGSDATRKFISSFSEAYDFIIFDLPPINVVSDALVLSGLVDGFILVVRQDYTARRAVVRAVNQLAVSNAGFLGFVLNQASTKKRSYKYGKKYGYGYGGHYYSYSDYGQH